LLIALGVSKDDLIVPIKEGEDEADLLLDP
jgi:hypothetical protein